MLDSDDRSGRGDERTQPLRWQSGGRGCHRFAFDGMGLWMDRPAQTQAAEAMEDPHRAMRELCGLGY